MHKRSWPPWAREVIRGDRQTWARYVVVVDRVVAGVRDRVRGGAAPRHPEPPRRSAGLSPITGRYLTVDVEGSSRRLYFEESGHGQPVLCCACIPLVSTRVNSGTC